MLKADGPTVKFKLLVLLALLVSLTACGDSDAVFEGSNADIAASASETADSANSENGSEDTSIVRPQFLTRDCGSLPISDAEAGRERSSSTTMITEQVVSGRIDSNSGSNFEHFWTITLEPGRYNLVLDSATVSGDYKFLNTAITDLKGPGEDDDELLIRFSEANFRARYHEFIEVEQTRVMELHVVANDRAMDYWFAIFENGNPVPSPLFTDCPLINALSLDTTEALILPEQNSSDDDRWYLVDVEAQDYLLNSEAAIINCEDGNIEYEISHVDQVGQKSRMTDHERIMLEGTNATGNTSIKSLDSGPIWIRVQNHGCALNMELTFTADG